MPRRRILVLLLLTFLALFLVINVSAAPIAQDASPTPTPPGTSDTNQSGELQLSISDDLCLGCHNQPDQTMPLEDGSQLDLYVPAEYFYESVHGEMGYACVQCHTQVGEYPHPAFSAQDARDVSIQLTDTCKRCHASQYDLAQDSVHAAASNSGNRQAAICSDCHSAHETRRLTDPKTHELLPESHVWIPQTCAQCHNLIYEKYKDSVHGSALIGEGNQDVPTCIDCHGVHNIQDPTTNYFRLESPNLCARCHSDPAVVGKYGLSTDVLETYVADFHGTTQVLFESVSPDAQFNTPVCYDCHGVHDIASSKDPEHGLQVKSNLLARCQECHPDATESFPAAWMSHYTPSPDTYPIVYYIDLFYKILIPGVLGGMGLLVALDFSRMGLNRYRDISRKWQKQFAADKPKPETISETTDSAGQSEDNPSETNQTETDQHG